MVIQGGLDPLAPPITHTMVRQPFPYSRPYGPLEAWAEWVERRSPERGTLAGQALENGDLQAGAGGGSDRDCVVEE